VAGHCILFLKVLHLKSAIPSTNLILIVAFVVPIEHLSFKLEARGFSKRVQDVSTVVAYLA